MKKYDKYFKYYILKILNLIGILEKINIVVTKNVYGNNIKIPVNGKTGLYNLVDGEEWLYRLYVKLYALKKGSLIDVGIIPRIK